MTCRRRTISLVLAAGTLVLVAAGPSEPATASGRTPSAGTSAAGPDQSGLAAVDEYARTQLAELSLPGLAVAVVHDGQVVHLAGFGHADPNGRPVTPQNVF
jgi:CubicO group peptidase (beta-lactamase class C family)